MTLSKEALQWNEKLEHRDDPDGLNASRGIILSAIISVFFWAPVLYWVFG